MGMTANDAIGGYFGLERGSEKSSLDHVENSLSFDTIRSALLVLLQELASGAEKRLWFPAFVCPAVLEIMPQLEGQIKLCPYNISEDLTPLNLQPEQGDLIYHYPVFGLSPHDPTPGLIVDNAHALFAVPQSNQHTLYSLRKFVGVADGATLSSPILIDPAPPQPRDTAPDFLRLRAEKGAEAGYGAFQIWEEMVFSGTARGITRFSQNRLQAIDFASIRDKRQSNFNHLHAALGTTNHLTRQITYALSDPAFVPFSYPYLVEDGTALRASLNAQRIYTPTLWAELMDDPSLTEFERHLARDCVHVPIDQRYGAEDMQTLLNAIL